MVRKKGESGGGSAPLSKADILTKVKVLVTWTVLTTVTMMMIPVMTDWSINIKFAVVVAPTVITILLMAAGNASRLVEVVGWIKIIIGGVFLILSMGVGAVIGYRVMGEMGIGSGAVLVVCLMGQGMFRD